MFVADVLNERPQDLSRNREEHLLDPYNTPGLGENPTVSRPQIIVSPRKLEATTEHSQEQVSTLYVFSEYFPK